MQKNRSRSREVFFLGGWLFTDLLLLLTILFFVGNVTPPPPPAPKPTPPPPRLELKSQSIVLNIDPYGLINKSPQAKNAVKQQIRQWKHGYLSTRRVGLVVVSSGALNASLVDQALSISNIIYDLTSELGKAGFAFKDATHYDPLYTLNEANTYARLDIFLFAK